MNKLLLLFYELRLISPMWYAKYLGVNFGKGCDFQHIYFSSEPYLISIGNYVQITRGTIFFTHSGGWVQREKYPEWDIFGKINIGSNVYIGNSCLIMPGVTIGDNVIVGAGSVVTKSIPNNCVIAGNPAKYITDLNTYELKNKKFNLNTRSNKNKKDFLKTCPESKFLLKEMLK